MWIDAVITTISAQNARKKRIWVTCKILMHFFNEFWKKLKMLKKYEFARTHQYWKTFMTSRVTDSIKSVTSFKDSPVFDIYSFSDLIEPHVQKFWWRHDLMTSIYDDVTVWWRHDLKTSLYMFTMTSQFDDVMIRSTERCYCFEWSS